MGKTDNIKLQIELTRLQIEKEQKRHKMLLERLEKKKEIAELNLRRRE